MYINKSKQLVVGMLVIFGLLLNGFPVAYAAPPTVEPVDVPLLNTIFLPIIATGMPDPNDPEMLKIAAEMQARAQKYMHAIQQIEKHLKVNKDGLLVMNIASETELENVDAAVFAELAQSMNMTNKMISTGELQLSEISLQTTPDTLVTDAAVNCAGSNALRLYWWGGRKYLDSCNTSILVATIRIGGAICGLIPACGVLRPIVIAYQLYIWWLNFRWGRGICIVWTWAGGHWIWHQ